MKKLTLKLLALVAVLVTAGCAVPRGAENAYSKYWAPISRDIRGGCADVSGTYTGRGVKPPPTPGGDECGWELYATVFGSRSGFEPGYELTLEQSGCDTLTARAGRDGRVLRERTLSRSGNDFGIEANALTFVRGLEPPPSAAAEWHNKTDGYLFTAEDGSLVGKFQHKRGGMMLVVPVISHYHRWCRYDRLG